MLRSEIKPALSHRTASGANVPLDFRVVAETDDFAVVDKAPFVLVHPTRPDGPRTLWHGLRELFAFEIANGGQISIVNRLDRETSGLILVAKNGRAARHFGRCMEGQRMAKEYLAIVWGWPEWDATTIEAPLIREGLHRVSAIHLKRGVHQTGAPAITEVRVESRLKLDTSAGSRFSVVRAFPRTGRTHQIRVHLAFRGYPVVGDKIYGPDERLYLEFIQTGWTDALARRLLLPRHALHSARIAVKAIGDWSSPLPPDLQSFIDRP